MLIGPGKKELQSRIISGSVILLSGSTLAVVINLAYNVAVAHFLGPIGFGNATAVYTLLTLLSAVTLAFQIVSSKIVAQQSDIAARDAAFRYLQRAAWICGLATAGLLAAFDHRITQYLDLPGTHLVVILAVGAAFYVPLGARRGYVQGAFGFRKLATNLVFEGAARLIGSVVMVALGFGVRGVIIANSAAIAFSFFAITPKLDRSGTNPLPFSRIFRELYHASFFFAGQVLINNCDIVLVKHYFTPGDAGLYAAIAMVGRVTFSAATAIVNSMFPVIAGSKREDRKSLSLIGTALLLVLAIGGVIAIALRIMPSFVWATLFGSTFQIAGPHGFSYLLALYAITTTVYCLSFVVMTYQMSYKIANTTWYQLALSFVLIAGICKFHSSLRQVILVQLFLLVGFLVVIAVPFVFETLNDAKEDQRRPIRLLRRIGEDNVIAEFLRSDFGHEIYGSLCETHSDIILNPDLASRTECSTRRSIFSLRHRALWSELPEDTQWYEVKITAENLPQVRVFPRAQWTRVARGNFGITKVAERMRVRQYAHDPFSKKISDIRQIISADVLNTGAVVLIGQTDSGPLTVIDGNHRFVAAVIEEKLEHLTFVCGLSDNMTQCCWYKTNFFNLVRYGRNLLRHGLRVPNNESSDMLEFSSSTTENAPLAQ